MQSSLRTFFVIGMLCLTLFGCATKKTVAVKPVKTAPPVATGQNAYTTNQQCIDLIKEFEGVRYKAYVGPAGHWLIGYGHKAGVKQGMSISPKQAEVYLKSDLAEVELNVNRLIKVKVNRNQFSAMVCLAYNIGWGNFARSTLLRELNAGDFAEAADQFLVWRMVNGKVNSHQEKRRAREKAIFTQ